MKVISDPAYGTTALVFRDRDDLSAIIRGLEALMNDLMAGKSGLPAVFVQSPLGLVDERVRAEIQEGVLQNLLGRERGRATIIFGAESTERLPSTLETLKDGFRKVLDRLSKPRRRG